MLHIYLVLVIAIATEIFATSSMQASQQFTRFVPSLMAVLGYAVSLYMLSLTLKHMPVGIVYAIWSGLGIVGITSIGFFVFGQKLDLPALLGIGFIVLGVVIINAFSKSVTH